MTFPVKTTCSKFTGENQRCLVVTRERSLAEALGSTLLHCKFN